MELTIRPRRLRGNELLRKMARETRVDRSALIYPLFVEEGENIKEEIQAMPGQYRYSIDRLDEELERLQKSGVSSVLLFGIIIPRFLSYQNAKFHVEFRYPPVSDNHTYALS